MEIDHLNGEGLCPKVGWVPKGDGQVSLPKRLGLLPQHDAVERCPSRPDARPVDAHGIKRLGVHDVKAAASIHQHLGKPLHADDLVNHKRISAQMWDVL
jgi:hypothetical protein